MKRCFVISPIGAKDSEVRQHADDVLNRIIQPAASQCDLIAYRPDQLHVSGRITDQMFEAIIQEDFCIVVLTGGNPNVFYELGVAQAAGKPVIMLVEEGFELPFDLRAFRCIRYELRGVDPAVEQLVGYIRSLKAGEWAGEQILEQYQRKTKNDAYFVLFPSLHNDPFYLHLLAGISSNPTSRKDMTFVAPSHGYSGPQFLEALDGLLTRQRQYVAGLIAPTLEDVPAEVLRDRINRFVIPLVIVDINPYGESPLPDGISYVGVDNRNGGRQAARAMAKALGPDLNDKRVLVLFNDDQPDRHLGFLEEWQGAAPTLESCPFKRDLARELTTMMMSRAKFDGIFGISDEIALGAVEAVSRGRHPRGARRGRQQSTVVIGFDGISAATLLIDLQNTPLINTVVQDPYKMGERAIAILKGQMDSRTESRQEVLPVHMHVSLNLQKAAGAR